MSLSRPDRGDSSVELPLLAAGEVELQRMVAIAALGMCRALTAGAVTPSYACGRLFGSALLSRMEGLNSHPELVRAIHLVTELDDLLTCAGSSRTAQGLAPRHGVRRAHPPCLVSGAGHESAGFHFSRGFRRACWLRPSFGHAAGERQRSGGP
ncbi:DUF3969 family protein [Myxococcus sp. SDU36]|uniref:DUF3969 family protein n=1 Tax=Myxococcus sp. SDU36 TaxID=2831967 RepID=UPI002543F223|nr:DUF3969 family protein [Myxococcus sp. SDU36]